MNDSKFYISHVKIKNFKNFKNADIKLGKFNVIIGQNASGKSNLIQIFSFIKDIKNHGLADAIAFQGGNDYICNFSSKSYKLELEVHFSSDFPHKLHELHPRRDRRNIVTTKEMIYRFIIQLPKNSNYKILHDELEISCSFTLQTEENEKKYQGKVFFTKKGTGVKRKYDFPSLAGSILQNHYEFFKFSPLTETQLLLESPVLGYIIENWKQFLDGIGIYDFDPKLLKKPTGRRASSKLEYDGANIANVLDKIRKQKESFEIFQEVTKDALGFYKTLNIERNSDGSIRFNMLEGKSSRKVPAIFLSDGTVNIFALIICLFIQKNHITIIEEPERNIHPELLSKIISYMKDASKTNQIIITTHNPEILDYVDLTNMYLLIRKKDGNSIIMEPKDHKMVKQFIEDMKMSEMVIQNMLGDKN